MPTVTACELCEICELLLIEILFKFSWCTSASIGKKYTAMNATSRKPMGMKLTRTRKVVATLAGWSQLGPMNPASHVQV